jgi:hypothetical protein
MDSARLAVITSELTQLNNAFAYFLDHDQLDAMIELFTPDAHFDRAGAVHRGHEEIRQVMGSRPKLTARHQLTNFHFFDVTDDSAEGVVCAMVYHGPPRDNGTPSEYQLDASRLMEFRDTYTCTAQGWRIASRAGTPILVPQKHG